MKDKYFNEEARKHRYLSAHEERDKKTKEPEEMTELTRQAIIQSKFDFATMSGCISDIRKSFWNIDRINTFYKDKIKATHSHFY